MARLPLRRCRVHQALATGLLTVGAIAPEFELRDQAGDLVRLSELLTQGSVVVFFYPAAMSPGCTAQSSMLGALLL